MIVVEGKPVVDSYVVERMLAEFAAAVVVFAQSLWGSFDEAEDGISFSSIRAHIEGILQDSYAEALPYFLQCLERGHKSFIWTGPPLEIHPRSDSLGTIMPLLTVGALLDLPSHPIYPHTATTAPPSDVHADVSIPVAEKRPYPHTATTEPPSNVPADVSIPVAEKHPTSQDNISPVAKKPRRRRR